MPQTEKQHASHRVSERNHKERQVTKRKRVATPFRDNDNVDRARKTVRNSCIHTGCRRRYDNDSRALGEVNRERGLYVFSPSNGRLVPGERPLRQDLDFYK
jgi:hypothetical protein